MKCWKNQNTLSVWLVLAFLSLPGCLPSSGPSPQGNGSGYGFRSLDLSVQENGSLQFPLDNVSGETASGFQTQTGPQNGSFSINSDGGGLYQPNSGYIGLDQFSYSFQSSTSGPIQVMAFVDVKPCFRVPTQYPLTNNVQIISIFGSNTFPNAPAQTFTVNVQSESTPPTLVLISQLTPMTWTINPAPGAQIQKIVVASMYTPFATVVGAPAGTPIETFQLPVWAYNWSIVDSTDPGPNSSVLNQFGKMISAIRNDLQLTETAFQGCYQASQATVPFSPQTLGTFCGSSYTHYNYSDQQCDGKCGPDHSGLAFDTWDPNDLTSNASLSNSNLTLTTNGNIPAQWVWGNTSFQGPFPWGATRALQGESCGKYYYELTLDEGAVVATGVVYKIFPFLPLGLQSSIPSNSLYPNGLSPTQFPRVGDNIGVAVDLDAGQIYYSLNGSWIANQNPANGTNGIDLGLWTYDPVFPAVELSTTGSATANFGQSAFHNPVPSGFLNGFR